MAFGEHNLLMVRMPIRRILMLAVVGCLLTEHSGAATVTYPRDPEPYAKPRVRVGECVRRHIAKDQSFIVLLNHCDRSVFVSVIEFGGLHPDRWCAVFGLQDRGYGKAYSPGDWFDFSSLAVSSSADRALENCGRTGYETEDRAHGEFIRITASGSGKRSEEGEGEEKE